MSRHNDDTDAVEMLLPWYVNGTLAADEHATVERHLVGCAECRTAVLELQQIATAIEKGEPTPLVPEPPISAFLDKTSAGEKSARSMRRISKLAVAASILALIAVSYWIAASLPDPQIFQTVMEPSSNSHVVYVFDIETAVAANETVLAAISEEFAGSQVVQAGEGFRLTVSMPSATMEELDEFAQLLRQINGVQRVDIVGVQLPLK